MSILIKGIKMPRACQVCPLGHWNKLDKLTGCEIVRRYVPKDDIEFWEKDKPSWCPLVEVPTPHGPLIDAGALYKQTAEWEAKALAQLGKSDKRGWAFWNAVLAERTAFKHDVMDAPVIIGAEEGSVDDDPSHPFADDVMMGGAEEGANNAPENG